MTSLSVIEIATIALTSTRPFWSELSSWPLCNDRTAWIRPNLHNHLRRLRGHPNAFSYWNTTTTVSTLTPTTETHITPSITTIVVAETKKQRCKGGEVEKICLVIYSTVLSKIQAEP
jgi:hypothetical protein